MISGKIQIFAIISDNIQIQIFMILDNIQIIVYVSQIVAGNRVDMTAYLIKIPKMTKPNYMFHKFLLRYASSTDNTILK